MVDNAYAKPGQHAAALHLGHQDILNNAVATNESKVLA